MPSGQKALGRHIQPV